MSLHLIRLRWLPKNHGYYTPVSQNPQELPDFTYLFVPNYPYIRQEKCYKIGNPGTSMSKLLSRRSRDFFTGIPNIYSASPDLGAPLDYVRACSSHHNETRSNSLSPQERSPAILSRQSSRIHLAFRCHLILFAFTLFLHQDLLPAYALARNRGVGGQKIGPSHRLTPGFETHHPLAPDRSQPIQQLCPMPANRFTLQFASIGVENTVWKSGDTILISFLKVNWCDASHPTCYDAFFIVIGAQDSVSFRSKVQGSY